MDLKKRFLISIIVISVILIITVAFIVWPTIRTIKNINQKISQQRSEIEHKYDGRFNLRKTITNLKDIKAEIPMFDKIFVAQDKEVDFISFLEKAASTDNLIQNITINTKEGKTIAPDIKALPLELSLTGNTNRVMHYLSVLDKMDYQFNIDSINLYDPKSNKAASHPSSGYVPGQIGATIKGNIYYRAKVTP